MTERCGCERVDITSLGDPEPVYLTVRYCPAHRPPPTPLDLARAEVDAIAARHLGDTAVVEYGFRVVDR